MMWHSLRLRLLLTIVGVALVAIVVVGLFTNQELWRQFQFYLQRNTLAEMGQVAEVWAKQSVGQDRVGLQALAERLGEQYQMEVSLLGADGHILASSDVSLLGQLSAVPMPFGPELDNVEATILQIRDSSGLTVGFWFGEGVAGTAVPFDRLIVGSVAGQVSNRPDDSPVFTFSSHGVPVTSTNLFVSAMPFSQPLNDGQVLSTTSLISPMMSQQIFVGAVNRSFFWAVSGALLLAMALSLGLSRRILHPVEELTQAARQLETGDLNQRVVVHRQDELGQLAHAFNAMADGLQKQEMWRRNMVTDIAHELRTPLTNIRGYLEGIQDGVVVADSDTIHSLHEETMLLSRLVADLQELSLAEAGQLGLTLQTVTAVDLILPVVQAMQPLAQAHGVGLVTAVAPHLPCLQADPERIGQVLRNLLHNALSHTPRGGTVQVTAQQEGSEIIFQVQDNGSGIEAEHLPHLFDRFYRVDPSRTRATGGQGLGLAIAKTWVELHNGRIEVSSSPGKGTTFFFYLPIATKKA